MRTDPQLYQRDCRHCWQYSYHEDGEHRGKPHIWRGKPLERPKGTLPPCMTPHQKCQKGNIDQPNTLTNVNAQVIAHYRECRAVLEFPKDATVRKNAGIINEVERMIDRMEYERSRIESDHLSDAIRSISGA